MGQVGQTQHGSIALALVIAGAPVVSQSLYTASCFGHTLTSKLTGGLHGMCCYVEGKGMVVWRHTVAYRKPATT